MFNTLIKHFWKSWNNKSQERTGVINKKRPANWVIYANNYWYLKYLTESFFPNWLNRGRSNWHISNLGWNHHNAQLYKGIQYNIIHLIIPDGCLHCWTNCCLPLQKWFEIRSYLNRMHKNWTNLSYLKSLFEFFARHKYGLYDIICHVLS